MNAVIIPRNKEIIKEYIQFSELFFSSIVIIVVVVIKDKMLIQNFVPNLNPNVFFAIKNWMKQVENCTQRLVNAAPCALNFGINMKFNATLIITPIAATKFNCLKLPLAVSKVPKMYVIDIETKLPINI